VIEPPAAVWADPRVVVRDSGIEGRGLFAAEAIEAGEPVLRLGGRLVSDRELAARLEEASDYVDTVAVYPDRHLVLPVRTALHFGNHSCDPTLWFTGPYEVRARRRVEPGEELTLDYGTCSAGPDVSLDCACGAATCRGRITGDDWRRPELQDRYGDHWTPVLLARIAAGP
jgi:SET domain-containing protein